MPSKKPYIMIRTNQEIINKFQEIAESENRSMSNMGEILIIKAIKDYEAEHGEIKAEEKSINVHHNKGVIIGDNGTINMTEE